MKKTLWTLVLVIVILLGIILWQFSKRPTNRADQANNTNIVNIATTTNPATASFTTFTSANKLLSFTYPSILSVSEKNNVITLHHQINYPWYESCSLKGDAVKIPTLTDFQVTMRIYSYTIASTTEIVSPYIPKENFNNDTLKISPGFIDAYNIGTWNGYKIYEGAEGCGQVTYYIPLSLKRTLVIQNMLIEPLSDIVDPQIKAGVLHTLGSISPEQSVTIFNEIIKSLKTE